MTTPLAIYVIAKGGKYLGNDISGATVTVRHTITQELLATGLVQGGSGDLWHLMIESRPRTTPLPTKGASVFIAEISSNDNTPIPVTIEATGPGAGLQSVARVSTQQWIVPGLIDNAGNPIVYTSTLELPGLIVQVMQPPTHLNVTQPLPQTINFEVNVAMMCGCPIDSNQDTDGSHTFPNPWNPNDFMVGCFISCQGQPTQQIQLNFDASCAPGRFTAQWTMVTAGFYSGHFYAYQISTGNTGTATVSFFQIGS